ncbi:mechanosensitive ion channel family protein [Desulfurivibrio alkaliphilus]|uniref:MscS Mechanosensitive ion channel n=1 Tax=Desulfurivibrio alkaliphilus (strain DSM 19089 / UNIQEM U267 / AHT2) TaxID=589865 RepID=D6Z127_DESAT|nr:mechanosensitive ion channel family protein [Desulfurivibrio alkaliphilus]ADH87287.1 MscS Mechanosensitive ion channel [Desulfurivibrio alkaliphilus AHT 2]
MIQDLFAAVRVETMLAGLRALILLGAGLLLATAASRLSRRLLADRLSAQARHLLRRAVFYGILVLFVASAMRELGFSLAVIMGAAGVLTVAIGFASQTTASNLISGIFLIGERSFEIGDFIKVGDTFGEVLSIDALSVKLRTFDNLFVRIPNETMIKSEVTTLNRFPIRRLDLKLGVAYKEDIGRVQEVLMAVANANPLCLDEPAPLFIFLGFGDSALELQFSVWARRENFLDLRNGITAEIKAAFDQAGIEIPFPHRTIYTGEVTKPFPITLVETPQGGNNLPPTGKGSDTPALETKPE